MPGRQAHGRPLLGAGSGNGKRKNSSKAKSSKKALNAFAIASEEYGNSQKVTPRDRELDIERTDKRSRAPAHDEDDDEDDEAEDEAPRKKQRRGDREGGKEEGDSEAEYGSDSSGNEWKIGVDADNDSEIESDDAFGDSDEEKFSGYKFRGSKDTRARQDDDEDDDADGASLGSDAIDLAAALDLPISDDEDNGAEKEGAGSDDEDSDAGGDSAASDASSDVEDDEDEDEDDADGMKTWVSKFSGVKEDDETDGKLTTTSKPKLGLKDLGLLGVKDPQLKKSLKLMNKEEKSSKPQKLEVPLERRQQARIDRAAAYGKTNETLDKWTETVKQNRRADHVVFPLPQTETGLARHDNSEIRPLNQQAPGTELEQAILSIMEESGLGPSAQKEAEEKALADEAEARGLSRSDLKSLWQEKRRERELQSREEARAKRIKKIKSKAYHRVHRKQRERDDMREHEARIEAGEIDSDEEREAQDRRRAEERMGSRHRESKWAKLATRGGRAAWDEDVRLGVAGMARRDQELRRRIEGRPAKGGDDSDDESDYSGDSEDVDDRKRLLDELKEVAAAEEAPGKSKLLNMPFMKKAEAAKKKANDELIQQIRRELASDGEEMDEMETEPQDVGRRRFGLATEKKPNGAKAGREDDEETIVQASDEKPAKSKATQSKVLSAAIIPAAPEAAPQGDAWSQPVGKSSKRRGKKGASNVDSAMDLDLSAVAVAAPASAKVQTKPSKREAAAADDLASDDEESHMPVRFKESELIERAFGGLDVVGEFQREKADVEAEDDDKIIDNTLPGWGSWAGEGVSAREKKKHQGRFLTKQKGIKKKDRKDAKLQNVIINEKRIKKNEKYMASQLPHPYESKLQYERAMRLPVGPEWMTKESFQEATKPRVLIKQGIIAPMAKPSR